MLREVGERDGAGLDGAVIEEEGDRRSGAAGRGRSRAALCVRAARRGLGGGDLDDRRAASGAGPDLAAGGHDLRGRGGTDENDPVGWAQHRSATRARPATAAGLVETWWANAETRRRASRSRSGCERSADQRVEIDTQPGRCWRYSRSRRRFSGRAGHQGGRVSHRSIRLRLVAVMRIERTLQRSRPIRATLVAGGFVKIERCRR